MLFSLNKRKKTQNSAFPNETNKANIKIQLQ